MFPEQNHSVVIHNSPLNQSSSQVGFSEAPRVVYETIQCNNSPFEGSEVRRSNSIGFENRMNMSPRNHHSPDRVQRTTYYELSPSKRHNMGNCGENYTTFTTYPSNVNHVPGEVHTIVHSPSKNYYSMRGREGFTEIYEMNECPSSSRCQMKYPMDRQVYVTGRPRSPRHYNMRPDQVYVNKENMSSFPHNMDHSMGRQFMNTNNSDYFRRGMNGSYNQY